MASYRQRMRAAGLRPVQIWVPDSRSPDFAEKCHRQARAVASDPAGDELMRFVASVYQWPEPYCGAVNSSSSRPRGIMANR
ncbi:MAG TPA: antitoxin MazE family protein, partial [Gemmataceae bacterium]|nr:antitoxin MazE family protein [Gemmataceae bacterium]